MSRNSEESSEKVSGNFGNFQENRILKFQNHENVVRQSGSDPLRAAKLCGIDRSHREGKTVLSDFQKNVSTNFWSFFCENFDIFLKIWGSSFLSAGFPEVFLRLSSNIFWRNVYSSSSTSQWAQKLDHTIKTRQDIYVLLSLGANCPRPRTTNSATYSRHFWFC